MVDVLAPISVGELIDKITILRIKADKIGGDAARRNVGHELERLGDFGGRFVALARSVYTLNDKRAALKRQINAVTSSGIVDEKSYQPY